MDELDEVDRGILHLLQADDGSMTPVDMSERLPVSDQTVRNRIDELRSDGIIEGFVPRIDYATAGFPIRLEFTCTAPPSERADLASAAVDLTTVVHVEEFLGGRDNVRVLAVASDTEEVDGTAGRLEDLGLTVEREQLRRTEHSRPFDGFGADVPSGG